MSSEGPKYPVSAREATHAKTPVDYWLLILLVVSLAVMKNLDLPLVHRKLQLSDIIFLALASVVFIRYRDIAWGALPSGTWMVLVFPLGLLPSFLATKAFGQSFIQLAGFLYLIGLYLLINLLLRSEARWWGVVRVWFWTTIGVVALAWVGWFLSRFLDVANPLVFSSSVLELRFLSTFHHPTMLAAYINASLAPLFLHLRRRGYSKASMGAILFIVVLTAINTKARASAGVLLSAALLWYWCVPNTNRASRRLLAGAAGGLAVMALITCFWWIVPLRPVESLGGLRLLPNNVRNPYYYFHTAAVGIGRDHPWTGVGLEQYNSHMLDYIDWEEARSAFQWTKPDLPNTHSKGLDPHSTYFGYWAEAGLPGLLGLGALLGWFLLTFWRASKREPPLVPSVFLAVFLGFAFNAYFLDIVTLRFFWAMAALGTVALNRGIKTE